MENLLSDIELEEIANYALNPSNGGHRHNKKKATMEDVDNLLNAMARDLKGIRENYLKCIVVKQKNYYELLN